MSSALKVMKARQIAAAEPQDEPATSKAANSRTGKVHVGAWLSPAYKQSLLLIRAADPEKDAQDLIAEALNDLFEKYRVPTVRD